MTIVEGIGDEVVHISIGVFVVLLSIVAWWSTYIREVTPYRTIVIVERHNSRLNSDSNSAISESSDLQNDTQEVEPLGGLEVSRSIHTTISSNEDTEELAESESSRSSSAFPLTPQDDAFDQTDSPTPTNESSSEDTSNLCGFHASVPVTQSETPRERPLLVGDYVNPNLQPLLSSQSQTTNVPSSTREDNADRDYAAPCSATSADTASAQSKDSSEGNEDDTSIRIRLKFLNDEEKVVDGKLSELLGDFKQRHFRTELASNKIVFIYNGHILQQDNSTLATCGIFNNCVVHCLVHPRRNNSSSTDSSRRYNNQSNSSTNTSSNMGTTNATTNTNDDWSDLGGIFYALVTIVLCSAWYWRFQHSHLFSFTATAALTSITAIFSIFVFSITFFHNDEIPIEII